MPLGIRLGIRMARSRGYGALSRFMSLSSTLGIALGVVALIVGLSAMNGFEREMEERVLALVPHATYTAPAGFRDSQAVLSALKGRPGVLAAAAALEIKGVLRHGQSFAPIAIEGIDPSAEGRVTRAGAFSSVPLA
ncbi:MAG: lipoprotein-releasing system transmembrane subunit LolE, partial [Succinivibrionaceae bacterium]|nr:lipoprotein-releasing system transmembrane subunit LolE [Succinivibrionaceae bacterium]